MEIMASILKELVRQTFNFSIQLTKKGIIGVGMQSSANHGWVGLTEADRHDLDMAKNVVAGFSGLPKLANKTSYCFDGVFRCNCLGQLPFVHFWLCGGCGKHTRDKFV